MSLLLAPLLSGLGGQAARLVAWGLAALAVWGAVHVWQMGLRQQGYDTAMAGVQAANQAAQTANRSRARAAEVRYVERDRVRVEAIKEIIMEVKNETQNLAACKLDAGDVRVLNAAADALGGAADRPAPAAADIGLPAPASAGQ